MSRSLLAACLIAATTHGLAAQEPAAPAAPDLSPGPVSASTNSRAVFLEAWRITKIAFYDPAMHGVHWDAVREQLLPAADIAATPARASAVINQALARLNASHTAHYHPDQREYYEILDIFFPGGIPESITAPVPRGPIEYTGIGLATTTIDGRVFAADVYTGGPADLAGILPGDQLISANLQPYSDIAPFRGREGRPTIVTIQRTPDESSRQAVEVTPALIRPRELFLSSLKDGARLIGHGGRRIAYIRVRSYAHSDYHDAVKELLFTKLADADALVLDLRGGWGGASPGYMDIFNPTVPRLTFRSRDGQTSDINAAWFKPAVVLIDGETRSGKEVLAHAFKKHGRGTLVGASTAGAVLGGSTRLLSDGSVLYVAIRDVEIDGERLEGAPVAPHILVNRDLPYSAGRDPQLEAALDAAVKPPE